MKTGTDENRRLYTQQQSCLNHLSLSKKSKREFYGNINKKDAFDKKLFWKTLELFLSDETVIQTKIALLDKNLPLTRDRKAAATLALFFTEVIVNLIIPRTFKSKRITIFISSLYIELVTHLNDPALGVLKHHYITKRFHELLIGNSRFLIYNLLNQLHYCTV